MANDLRYAIRSLTKSPGFTAVVVLTLALGIGANTAVFTVVSHALVHRLPYPSADRLLVLYGASSDNPGARGYVAAAEVAGIEETSRSLTSIAAFGLHGGYTHVGDTRTEMWQGSRVGPTFFPTLGVGAWLGRTIDQRDVEPGAQPVVVLSYSLWQRALGGDSAAIGRVVSLNDVATTVVGVMPPAFVSPWRTPEIWLPLDLDPILARPAARSRMLTAVARLSDGATLAQAREELRLLVGGMEPVGVGGRGSPSANPVPVRDAMVGEARPVLLVVMGAAVLVLLLACVNVAGLFLARATAKRREMGVCAALGARPTRLIQRSLTESAVLGVLGGALGVVLAIWIKDVLVNVGAGVLPVMGEPPRINLGVLAFAAAVSLASAVAFGLVPALLAARSDLSAVLNESGRSAAGGRVHTRVGRALVAGQVALAVVLLIGAGLLGRTLAALEGAGMGFSTGADVLTFRVNLQARRYRDASSQTQFFDGFLERVRALPGAAAAGAIEISPWNGWYRAPVEVAGSSGSADSVAVVRAPVSDGYFAALGIPVLAGRAILATDRYGAPAVAVVSASMARLLWPSGNPIGARFRFGGIGGSDIPITVVGVVGDVRETPGTGPPPVAYVSAWQHPSGGYEFVVRTAGDASTLIAPIEGELRRLDPTVPLVRPRTMADEFRSSLTTQRLPMAFTSAFALLALTLAALGIYGVTAYYVSARTRELGIRTALGSRRRDALWLVLRQGLITWTIGLAVGLPIAAAASWALQGLLYGVTTHDPVTFLAAPAVLLVAGAGACLLPARRAARVDPMEALRHE